MARGVPPAPPSSAVSLGSMKSTHGMGGFPPTPPSSAVSLGSMKSAYGKGGSPPKLRGLARVNEKYSWHGRVPPHTPELRGLPWVDEKCLWQGGSPPHPPSSAVSLESKKSVKGKISREKRWPEIPARFCDVTQQRPHPSPSSEPEKTELPSMIEFGR